VGVLWQAKSVRGYTLVNWLTLSSSAIVAIPISSHKRGLAEQLLLRREDGCTPLIGSSKRRNDYMKLGKSMALILVLTLGSIGVAQDLATDVGQGAKDVGKATGKASKDAAQGTKDAAKDAARATDKAAKDTAQGTKKVAGKTARAGERVGKESGKEIEKGAKDASKGVDKGAKEVGKGVDKGAKTTVDALK
jgi:hypothetical protein